MVEKGDLGQLTAERRFAVSAQTGKYSYELLELGPYRYGTVQGKKVPKVVFRWFFIKQKKSPGNFAINFYEYFF